MKNASEINPDSRMRPGWTFIELIFIIIVIGILASIAIGKLSTTRDDAKLSAIVSNMHICITDANSHYTATGQDYTDADHPLSCDKDRTVCYDIDYSFNGKDFNVTLDTSGTDSNGDTHSYCEDIEMVGGHLEKNYTFGGRSITN